MVPRHWYRYKTLVPVCRYKGSPSGFAEEHSPVIHINFELLMSPACRHGLHDFRFPYSGVVCGYGAQLQAAMLSREHGEITKNMKAMAASRTHEQFKIDANDRAVFFSKATGRPFVGDQVNNGCHSASYVANMQSRFSLKCTKLDTKMDMQIQLQIYQNGQAVNDQLVPTYHYLLKTPLRLLSCKHVCCFIYLELFRQVLL